MTDNRWTETKVNSLISHVKMSQIYSLCHTHAYEYYKRLFGRTTVFITFLSAATTILEGANLLLDEPFIGISLTILFCAALSGILGTYIKTKDPSQMAAAHQELSKGYNRIVLEIEAELSQEPEERQPGQEFIRSITKSLIELSTGGQILPSFIFNKINNEIKSGNLKPESYWSQNIRPLKDSVRTVAAPTVIDVDNIEAVPEEESDRNMPSMELRMNDNLNKLVMEYQASRFRFG